MSAPPTSSPLTNSCGMVGQLEIAESSSRMRGSGRMSTAANGAPTASSAATVRAEKPHAGCSGEPFMKRITGCSSMACWSASRISVASLMCSSLGLGLDGKGVDRAADLGPEDVVDQLVLRDARQTREGGRGDGGAEVVAAAREVGDLGLCARNRGLDALLELVGVGHASRQGSDGGYRRYTS